MISFLTQYLLRYRRVAIPHVGTIEIQQEPAELNFVEKLLLPPRFAGVFKQEDEVSDHQVKYLAAMSHSDDGAVLQDLDQLGRGIKKKMRTGGFQWNGVGNFSEEGHSFIATGYGYSPVPAVKLSREDARHQVLVGDREVLSGGTVTTPAAKPKKSFVSILAWALLALGIGVALWLLITGRFSITSFGLRTAP